MLKRLCVFLALAGMLSAAPVAPVRRAMVLTVQGEVLCGDGRILVGQLLDDSNLLELKENSKITLLLLNKGQRVAVAGKGKLRVSGEGVNAREGATVSVLGSNQQKLALNGENHRTLGGITTRNVELGGKSVDSTAFDRVRVREGQGLVISRPAGTGNPPALCFHYTSRYRLPQLLEKGQALCLLPTKEQKIFSPVIAGQKVGSRWQWEVDWPKADHRSMGMVVTEEDDDKPLLYTWVYQTTPKDEAELRALAREVGDWKKREPESLEPLLLYASLLEDRGYLEQANQEIDRALAIQNAEPGLLEMKARVLTELGRFSEASRLPR